MASLSLDIAKRYLFGKKSTHSINIITGISIFGISIGTAALILILSVFNGFEGLLSGLFNAFNPDLKITPREGKFFELDDDILYQLRTLEGVEYMSCVIEEVSLFEYKDSREIGTIKGVDADYIHVTRLDSLIINGQYRLKNNDIQYGILGAGMRNRLSVNMQDKIAPLTVYMPQKKQKIIAAKEFKARDLYIAGIFSVRSETDYQYLISNLEFVQNLLDQEGKFSALELKAREGYSIAQLKLRLEELLPGNFRIQNRYEQDEAYLKVMEIEKWFSFLIAGMTMLLIAFNLVGALWMIVLDKKQDIAVLKALGYNTSQVRQVFLKLGLLITALGIFLGFSLALLAYFLQKNYGIIGIPEGFLIDSYPVRLKLKDFALVSITVVLIGVLASLLPANKAVNLDMTLKSQGL